MTNACFFTLEFNAYCIGKRNSPGIVSKSYITSQKTSFDFTQSRHFYYQKNNENKNIITLQDILACDLSKIEFFDILLCVSYKNINTYCQCGSWTINESALHLRIFELSLKIPSSLFYLRIEELSTHIIGQNVTLSPHHTFRSVIDNAEIFEKQSKNDYFRDNYFLRTTLSHSDFILYINKNYTYTTPILPKDNAHMILQWCHPKIGIITLEDIESYPNVVNTIRQIINHKENSSDHDKFHALHDLNALDPDSIQQDLENHITMLKEELRTWSNTEYPRQHILNTLKKQSLITIKEE